MLDTKITAYNRNLVGYLPYRILNDILDQLDALADSQVMSENVEYFSKGEGNVDNPKGRSVAETAGIPTGIAPDISAQIARRKSRQISVTATATAAALQPPATQSLSA